MLMNCCFDRHDLKICFMKSIYSLSLDKCNDNDMECNASYVKWELQNWVSTQLKRKWKLF